MKVTLADLQTPRDTAVILIWASAAPRVMSMIPIVTALRKAGFAAYIGFARDVARGLEKTGVLDTIDYLTCSKFTLENLSVDVFVAAETEINLGPQDAIRVALYHSLPDHGLAYNYASMFRRKPQVGAMMDYFCTAVQQPSKRWSVRTYQPVIDEVFPETLLNHRREKLTLLPLGYPKIDLLIAKAGDAVPRDTITYAPTQTILDFSSVREAGAEIIAELLAGFPDHRIAFRPYPGRDVKKLRDIIARFADDPRFVLDTSVTGEDLMMRSAAVVTDRSSVAMSYALGLARPAVFFAIDGVKGSDPKGVVRFDPVGFRAGSPAAVREAVAQALDRTEAIAARIVKTRGNYIHNPGHAAGHLAEIMPDILAGRMREGWLAIPRRPFPSQDRAVVAAHLEDLAAKAGARTKDQSMRVLAAGFETTPLHQRVVNLLKVARKRLNLRRYRSRPTRPDRGSQQ